MLAGVGLVALLLVTGCPEQGTPTPTPGLGTTPLRLACGEQGLYAAAHDDCAAMTVQGEGACFCMLGYYWNGNDCVALNGACSCVGDDCDKLSETAEECATAHQACVYTPAQPKKIACGAAALYAAAHDDCAAMDIAGDGACFCLLGYYWNGNDCVALSGACNCVGNDCDKLSETADECATAHAACVYSGVLE